MGREVKRVPLDFDHPLGKVWYGYQIAFCHEEYIDQDYTGRAYGKSKQVARCGNAVCPPMAEAVVRANLPEWCGKKLRTMEELERAVTA